MIRLSIARPAQSIDLSDVHVDGSINGWNLAFAAVTLAVTWILGRLIRRATLGVLTKVPYGISEDQERLAGRIAKYAVWVLGFGVALTFLGAQIQPLLTAAVIVAVIAVLALRGIAENFGAGLVIQTRRPIQIGDLIESLGHIGTVTGVNGRSVVIETSDGRTVHLPNVDVLGNPIVNESVRGMQRSELEARVACPLDQFEEVRDTITTTLAFAATVASDPAPTVGLTLLEPRRMTLHVRFWHSPTEQSVATSDAAITIARALAAAHLDATIQVPPAAPPLPPPPAV